MTTESNGVRLFFGARISVGAVDDLVALVESMQPTARASSIAARWLAPETYHITLKFLGWTHPEIEPALRDMGEAVAQGARPFEISMRSVGAFPSGQKARVIWAGVDKGAEGLAEIAAQLDARSAELGFAPEQRPYHPHVTIARLKKLTDVSRLLLPFSEERFRSSRIDRLVLFRSETRAQGVEYRPRAEWALSAP